MKYAICVVFCLSALVGVAQKKSLSRQDTLRGTITKERAWWDVQKYDISIQPDYNSKTLQGSNTILFKTLKPGQVMQIDLMMPMEITSATYGSQSVTLKRDSNVYYLDFGKEIAEGVVGALVINFKGKPREAKRPPWDGGWIWTKDEKGRPWMSVACQGLGASVWYPCKDHQSDEPDQGANLSITVGDNMMGVGNGKLVSSTRKDGGLRTFTWAVTNPINNYNIVPYIGKYVHWHETYKGEQGVLDNDYWVLDYELEKGKKQFKQVPKMLKCFEHWFGPYPFYEDGFKLVQAPHLGMEHQSAVAYGNRFGNGYLGRDLSETGWGLKWDFIIVHESGHEWFGNNITSNDIADMWIHESFTNYSETLFTTCEFGVEAGNDYVIGTRANIQNKTPIIGIYGVNRGGSGDMYYKGGNMLHTIRQLINDDEKFRSILRGLNETLRHRTVNTNGIENYVSLGAGIDLSKVFDQYLRTIQIPVLEYKVEGKSVSYRWVNVVEGFDMRVKLKDGSWLSPTTAWQQRNIEGATELIADRNFYIETKRVQ